jgi:hypothetical protein
LDLQPDGLQLGLGFDTVKRFMYQAPMSSFITIYSTNLRFRCSASFSPRISLMMISTMTM